MPCATRAPSRGTAAPVAGCSLHRNAWASAEAVTPDNVITLMAVERSRWTIETENNNTLESGGYDFEHNDGHGKRRIAALIASLILLAFLARTVRSARSRNQALRPQVPSRQAFFEHLRAFETAFWAPVRLLRGTAWALCAFAITLSTDVFPACRLRFAYRLRGWATVGVLNLVNGQDPISQEV
jgi:hypothetical protein